MNNAAEVLEEVTFESEIYDMKEMVLEQALRENMLLKGHDFPVVSL